MNPFPIFDSWSNVSACSFEEYLKEYPLVLHAIKSLNIDEKTCLSELKHAFSFLKQKSKKSEQTYNSFRNEIEKFLLWMWIKNEKLVSEMSYVDIENYVDFYVSPEKSWCGTTICTKFVLDNGAYLINSQWKPFKVDEEDFCRKVSKIKRRLSQSTISRFYAILSVYFDDLVFNDFIAKNYAKKARNESGLVVTDKTLPKVKRFTDEQWAYVVECLTNKANESIVFERHLFLITCMRTCYLRISELAVRGNYDPNMSNFEKDSDGWQLLVFGKRQKLAHVSVPDAFLPYLARYRASRGLSELPIPNDPKEKSIPIIHKLKGQGSPTSRQLDRVFKEAIQLCVDKLIHEGNTKMAKEINLATTHMLRHTGASIDSETMPTKLLSEELRHSNSGTTDRIYIHSDRKAKASYAKTRRV